MPSPLPVGSQGSALEVTICLSLPAETSGDFQGFRGLPCSKNSYTALHISVLTANVSIVGRGNGENEEQI